MRPRDTGASRRFTRWIPAIAAPIAIGAAVVLVPLQANAAVDLPDLTPEELIEFAASSDVEALSGTIEQESELGLPDLSGLSGAMGGAGGAGGGDGEGASASDLDDLIDLATGSHTARVYLDGSNSRMQVLDRLAERDVVVTEDGAWVYDSREQAATHVTVDRAALEALRTEAEARGEAQRAQLEAELGAPLPTPDEVLDQALAKLGESTDVSVGTDARVAGREVYELVLEPQDDDTLVGEVSIAIDGENGVPLAASVTARGAEEPAFSIAFTDVSFDAPDGSVFEFTPPEGTTVTEHEVPVPTVAELEQWKADADAEGGDGAGKDPRPQVIGEDWSAVVVLPAGEVGADGQAADGTAADGTAADAGGEGSEGPRDAGTGLDGASAMLDTLTQAVDGGRLLTTSLVSVFFADDGRVLVGAVTPDRLLDAAASGR
jgi:outer membrane lipoprotein-sorting protein